MPDGQGESLRLVIYIFLTLRPLVCETNGSAALQKLNFHGFSNTQKNSFVTKVAALEQRIRSTTMLWMPEESSGEQALRMKHKMQEKLGKAVWAISSKV
jgi:hypothetical protein